MKTLENTYCRPTTEAEWDLLPNRDLWCRNEDAVFGAIDFSKQKVSGKTEIFVQHFIDLLEDRICKWRLEEVGFVSHQFNDDCRIFQLANKSCNLCICIYYDGTFEICLQQDSAEIRLKITTFTSPSGIQVLS